MKKIRKLCIDELRRRCGDAEAVKGLRILDLLGVVRHINDCAKLDQELKILKLKEKQLKLSIDSLAEQLQDAVENVSLTGADSLEWRLKSTLEDLRRLGAEAACDSDEEKPTG